MASDDLAGTEAAQASQGRLELICMEGTLPPWW